MRRSVLASCRLVTLHVQALLLYLVPDTATGCDSFEGPVLDLPRRTLCHCIVLVNNPVIMNMWLERINGFRWGRSIWLSEMHPQLLAVDQSMALGRIALCFMSVALCSWSHQQSMVEILALVGVLFLSVFRYYCCRYQPAAYMHWRWLLLMGQSLLTAFEVGHSLPTIATPAEDLYHYTKNLIFASGILITLQSCVLDREMFIVSCPCSFLLVFVSSYHTEGICKNGLLATAYGVSVTRSMFQGFGQTIHVVANLMRPFEDDPLLAVPREVDDTRDLSSCLCLVHTLLVTFGLLLPNALLYLYDQRVIELAALRRAHQLHETPEGEAMQPAEAPPQPPNAWWAYIRLLLTGFMATALGGTWAWAVLRMVHDV